MAQPISDLLPTTLPKVIPLGYAEMKASGKEQIQHLRVLLGQVSHPFFPKSRINQRVQVPLVRGPHEGLS